MNHRPPTVRDWIREASKTNRIKTIAAITGFSEKRLRDFGRGKDTLTELEVVTLTALKAAQR